MSTMVVLSLIVRESLLWLQYMTFGTETAKSILNVFVGVLPDTWKPASSLLGKWSLNK